MGIYNTWEACGLRLQLRTFKKSKLLLQVQLHVWIETSS